MARWGMVIDLARCIGCAGCQMACKSENGTPPGITWCRVEVKDIGKFPSVRRIPLPVQCMHCREPECEKVCPTGATQKLENGIVHVDSEICMGCRACVLACPYGARYFYEEETGYYETLSVFEELAYKRHRVKTVTKCDFCQERIEQGLEKGLKPGVDRAATPACVINCMTKGRFFGDLDDPKSTVSLLVASGRAFQLLPGHPSDPQVYYLTPGTTLSTGRGEDVE